MIGNRTNSAKLQHQRRVFAAVLILLTSPAFAQSGTTADATSTPYVVQPGDELEIKVHELPELSERAFVRPDGRMSLPLLKEQPMAGKTIAALTQQLTEAYLASGVREPVVMVQVRTFVNRKVFVGGEVTRPGLVYMPNNKSLLEALVESGGLTEAAKRGHAFVFRKDQDGKMVSLNVRLSATGNLPPEAANFQLEPLDTIIIAESGISKANRVMDSYVRKLSPVLLTFGFTYLFGPGGFIR